MSTRRQNLYFPKRSLLTWSQFSKCVHPHGSTHDLCVWCCDAPQKAEQDCRGHMLSKLTVINLMRALWIYYLQKKWCGVYGRDLKEAVYLQLPWCFSCNGVEEHHSQSSGGFCRLIHHKFRRSCKTYGMQALWRHTFRKICRQGVTIEPRKHIFKIFPLWELVSKMFITDPQNIGLGGALHSLLTVLLPTHTLITTYPESLKMWTTFLYFFHLAQYKLCKYKTDHLTVE